MMNEHPYKSRKNERQNQPKYLETRRTFRQKPSKVRKRIELFVENTYVGSVLENTNVPQVIERLPAWPGITTGEGQFWWST